MIQVLTLIESLNFKILSCKHNSIKLKDIGVVCKWIKKEKIYIPHWKETLILNVYKCGFLFYCKLNESHGR